MKKQVAMMLAFGGLTSAVGVAQADGTVTLYGLIDDGITHVHDFALCLRLQRELH
ncbi:hypothetical protein [Trinickia sp. EG282A]|uniref:hypothetical protein n=1 Tax=Trinickia sp. EG282A TaxID=3237013 RepID=UPI0034D32B3A